MNHKIIALILQVLKVAGSGLSHYGNEINSDNATHKQEKAEESVTTYRFSQGALSPSPGKNILFKKKLFERENA